MDLAVVLEVEERAQIQHKMARVHQAQQQDRTPAARMVVTAARVRRASGQLEQLQEELEVERIALARLMLAVLEVWGKHICDGTIALLLIRHGSMSRR
jgi:hypothetical protein